jgi:type IV fimbrial biogenesis protein FimT
MLAMNRPRSAEGGFTLIELMITVAVVAVFAGLAGPAFREMIASQRTRSATSALTESLWLARSEAVKRNADDVTFTVNNGTGSSWTIITGATTLHTQEGMPNVLWQKKCAGSETSTVYTFNRYGRLSAGAGKMQVSAGNTNRCMTISVTGRASVEDKACQCS